jgi:hypothetical protein
MGVLLLALAVAAPGSVVQRFSVGLKPARAGKPVSMRVQEKIWDDAAAQPPQLTRQVIRLQRGGKFNGRHFKRCKLAKLRAKGPKGCSKRSLIGRGTGTGSAKPIVDRVSAKLRLYNGERKGGRDTVYLWVFPDIGPTFVVVGTIKRTHGRYGHVLDFRVPPIKTLPGAPDASVTGVKTKTYRKRVTIRRKGHKTRRYLIVAPRRCHKRWRAESVFYYANGTVTKEKDSLRCHKRRHRHRH